MKQNIKKSDPDLISLVLDALPILASASSVAGLLLQQRSRRADKVDQAASVRQELLEKTDQLESELKRLLEFSENLGSFVSEATAGNYSLPDTRFTFGALSPDLSDRQIDQYANLRHQLADHGGKTIDIEITLVRKLPQLGIDLSEETIRRSERFRASLRKLSSANINYGRVLRLISEITSDGLDFVSALRNAVHG